MKKYIFFGVLALVLMSCKNSDKTLKINAEIIPFHKMFYKTDAESLKGLKKQYPYLFPDFVKDEVWLSKKKDPIEQALFKKVDSSFGNLRTEQRKLSELFQNIQQHKPDFRPPKTICLINNLDHENKVIYSDSLLLISLDMFLGKNNEVYQSFPAYLKKKYTKKHLFVAVAREIFNGEFQIKRGRSFLEKMIFQGKQLFFISCVLPSYQIDEILCYEKEKYLWAQDNESQVWSYFIGQDLLYSSDTKLDDRFLKTAPFSKFYFENDRKTPEKIGAWVGYNIVRSFARNRKISLKDLMALDAENIFRNSRYKPTK